MSDQTPHEVGERVEKVCPDCDEQLGHVVKTITKLGKISRVICSKCGKVGTFKASADTEEREHLSGKTGDPYDWSKTYKVGQIMAHSSFGAGKVMTVCNSRMIDVLFEDRLRRLVHSHEVEG